MGESIKAPDVLNLLTRLVAKSLAVLDDEAAEPRYRMLDSIRQYALEKLLDAKMPRTKETPAGPADPAGVNKPGIGG